MARSSAGLCIACQIQSRQIVLINKSHQKCDAEETNLVSMSFRPLLSSVSVVDVSSLSQHIPTHPTERPSQNHAAFPRQRKTRIRRRSCT